VRKTLEAEAAAGNASKVLEAWRTEQSKAPTPKLGFQTPLLCRFFFLIEHVIQ